LSLAGSGGNISCVEEATTSGVEVELTDTGGATSPILDGEEGTDIGGPAVAAAPKTAMNWDSVTQVEPTQIGFVGESSGTGR
jgi:hypothetical protein